MPPSPPLTAITCLCIPERENKSLSYLRFLFVLVSFLRVQCCQSYGHLSSFLASLESAFVWVSSIFIPIFCYSHLCFFPSSSAVSSLRPTLLSSVNLFPWAVFLQVPTIKSSALLRCWVTSHLITAPNKTQGKLEGVSESRHLSFVISTFLWAFPECTMLMSVRVTYVFGQLVWQFPSIKLGYSIFYVVIPASYILWCVVC